MQDMINNFLSGVDIKLVYILVGILVIAIIIAIAKKLVKLAIVAALIAVAVYMLVPATSSFREKYNFKVEDGIAIVRIDGKDFKLSTEDIVSIRFKNKGMSLYELQVKYSDRLTNITVPGFIKKLVESYAEKNDIKIDKEIIETDSIRCKTTYIYKHKGNG